MALGTVRSSLQSAPAAFSSAVSAEAPPPAKPTSLPRRALDAALEIPKAVARGAMGGIVVVGLPAMLVPPLLPIFAPFIPLAAAYGSAQGFFTGAINALTRLTDDEDFKPIL